MLAGNLVASDVMAFESYILVNGTVRPHASWSVSREIAGQFPDQVVAGGGVQQATGSIDWARAEDVSTTSANPWNASAGWLPRNGDRVEIWAGDGVTYWRQFTGLIDETSGDVGSGASSTLVDDVDRLNRRFNHDALLRVMPPRTNGGVRRGVGLQYTYFLDAALRRAGFNATPPLEARSAISVPAQGSMWPERGNVVSASAQTVDQSHAVFFPAPWGSTASNFELNLGPIVRLAPSEPVELTFMVAPDHAGNASMNAFYGATVIQLAAAGSRTVVARLDGLDVCSLAMGNAVTVSLLVKGGVWTLRNSAGATATGNATPAGTAVMDTVTLSGDANSRLAGFQVCYPSGTTEFQPVNYTPSAVLNTTGSLVSIMDAAPVIQPTKARDLIDEISKAALVGVWIDEEGIFQAVPSDVLRSRAPVQTVTTLDDIRSLSWSDSLLSVRSSIDVDYRKPFIDLGIYQNKLLYQGSMLTLESGDTSSVIISPDADEDWIEPDLTFEVVGTAGASANSNSGRGSITGAIITDGTTEALGDSYLTASVEQISPGVLKVTHTAKTLPAGQSLELRYFSESTTIWKRWLKESFPFIRSFARVDWTTATRTSIVTGPAYAPDLAHEAGPWLSRVDNTIVIDRMADFLADQTTTPSPVITGMRVGYDPRRQLGDVITVSSPTLMGVELTCLIISLSNSASGSYTQELGVMIIDAASTFTTYAEFAEAWGTVADYNTFAAAWSATQTYDSFAADPLRGT